MCLFFLSLLKSFGSTSSQPLWIRGIKPLTPLVISLGADHTPINRWAPYMELWEEETNSSPASMPPAVLGERVWTRPSAAPVRHTEICKQPWTSDEKPSGRSGDVSSRRQESPRWFRKGLEKMDSCVQWLEKEPCQHPKMEWGESRLRAPLF